MFKKIKEYISGSKKLYIICAAATLVILLAVFLLIKSMDYRMPSYVLEVNGLSANTVPSQAQAELRAEYEKFADIQEEYSGCSWVWAGGQKLYLIKSDYLRINSEDKTPNFTAVKFKDENGDKQKGYVIDPATQPKELGRIQLVNAKEIDFENASMSVRVGLRNGEISYDGAVYLWEKGSSEVLAVRAETYDIIEGRIVSFTDDGNSTHTCYILDTKI